MQYTNKILIYVNRKSLNIFDEIAAGWKCKFFAFIYIFKKYPSDGSHDLSNLCVKFEENLLKDVNKS